MKGPRPAGDADDCEPRLAGPDRVEVSVAGRHYFDEVGLATWQGDRPRSLSGGDPLPLPLVNPVGIELTSHLRTPVVQDRYLNFSGCLADHLDDTTEVGGV